MICYYSKNNIACYNKWYNTDMTELKACVCVYVHVSVQ